MEPNCLCKLPYFVPLLKELITERASWDAAKKERWPVELDLVAITALAYVKGRGFVHIKKNPFGWVTYEKKTSLFEFRHDDKIQIMNRLNKFLKYNTIFTVQSAKDAILFKGEVHKCDDDELQDIEFQKEAQIAGSIHFGLCGGYLLGQPVLLQYDIPRLLKSIDEVIAPIFEFIKIKGQFTDNLDYLKHIPLLVAETFFGFPRENCKTPDYLKVDKGAINTQLSHSNCARLIFISTEMVNLQTKAELVLYHFMEKEPIAVPQEPRLTSEKSSIHNEVEQGKLIDENRNMKRINKSKNKYYNFANNFQEKLDTREKLTDKKYVDEVANDETINTQKKTTGKSAKGFIELSGGDKM